ncbi:MAG: hypothetical protein LH610_12875 [Sphingomonas bacterium]|nr:hypothetical protein [Sphingomonas bacterium]
MLGPGRASDEERLPWLEPYREAAVVKPTPVASNKRGGGMLVGGMAAMVAALAAGYYIGQRDPRRDAPVLEVAIAPTTITPVATPTEAAPQPPVTAAAEAAPPPRKIVVATPKKSAKRFVRQGKIRSAKIDIDRAGQVRAPQEPGPAPLSLPAVRVWPMMPSPGPAGQVIQLGAFRNAARANAAYRTRLARYPLLGSMPRVVVPVVTKPRGQILYALRLGTTSRQQSGSVCRNLRASGDHCLVIG